ncbi:hypothetical protein IFM89_010494 [Coptis chinensis]|uniref:ENTH domain-containing protein n=1 Tax=Coptis chinensis TaxID=261450 RepID=A0A835GYW9_9MAGN|nr:hypothetical protein IFM89_010494 [Coptis chinensis]
MPSKFRRALGAVKDQTSIGLAKVSTNNSSNLEVAIVKATTHEEVPVEDRYINEILLLISSNKLYAAACAQTLAKRISRTRNWIVALKSLMIVLRVLQDGDPYFPREVLITMKHGGKILNLSNFRDDYNSSPWDYTAFVRTMALYLNDRLECFLTGRLQRRMVLKERDYYQYQPNRQRYNEHVRDMKPAVLLDRITYWQRLLDRAIGTRPTGAAKTNRLVQISLYALVRETFDLYRDISDGLALLLDSFFHLQHKSCVDAYQACIKSSKQFKDLSDFYAVCKDIGVGRSSEYPSVQKISEELIDTLQEFLKDKTSFPSKHHPPQLLLPPPVPNGNCRSTSGRKAYSDHSDSEPVERMSIEGRRSVARSEPHNHNRHRGISLEDLISATDIGTSPGFSVDKERKPVQLQPSSSIEDFLSMDTASPARSADHERNCGSSGKHSPGDDLLSLHTAGTSPAMSIDQRTSSALDLGHFDDHLQNQQNEPSISGQENVSRDDWELVLAETANSISSTENLIRSKSTFPDNLYNQTSTSQGQSSYNNPFLTLANELPIVHSPADSFLSFPTFHATPTFCAQNPNGTIENDLFNLPMNTVQTSSQVTMSQPHIVHEQQLWLQNQNEIIAKHIF